MASLLEEIRERAEKDLEFFITLVSPSQLLGSCHKEVISWWTREGAKTHQLLLFPRDHQKSRLIAYRVAWELTKDPSLRVLYISATANLAEKQLGFIKGIITSSIYRKYWPLHVNKEEGRRSKWTNSEIALDHPKRIAENIRDPSIFTGGLTTGLTGMHCDIAVLDDIVVYENAYTGEGRNKVRSQYSLLSSIEGSQAREWVVGTRYHPLDLYSELKGMMEEIFDEKGNKIDEEPIYEIFERAVEDAGDSTGEFLWPRQQGKDGKWYGFDTSVLSKKKGQYLDRAQFRAQYYNDPTAPDDIPVDPSKIQYYDKKFLKVDSGRWFFKEKRLNVYAAIDFAYSTNKRADFTAIVVAGIDTEGMIYVLDIDRFKTDKISDYFSRLLAVVSKWSLRKIRAEVSVAQQTIVNQLKELFRQNGISISIDEARPTRNDGNKQERIAAALEPRYENMMIWHYRGGNCQILEEELSSRFPPHDDVKDAFASVTEILAKPSDRAFNSKSKDNIIWNTRFRVGT